MFCGPAELVETKRKEGCLDTELVGALRAEACGRERERERERRNERMTDWHKEASCVFSFVSLAQVGFFSGSLARTCLASEEMELAALPPPPSS